MENPRLSILPLFGTRDFADDVQGLFSSHYEAFWFHSAHIIYLMLFLFGSCSLLLWAYVCISLRFSEMMPEEFVTDLRRLLQEKRYEKALKNCKKDQSLSAKILEKGIEARKQGPLFIKAAMQEESIKFRNNMWEKLGLLQEIAIAAPLVGLLGTILAVTFTLAEWEAAADSSLISLFLISLAPAIVGGLISMFSLGVFLTMKKRTHFLLSTIQNEILTLVRSSEMDMQ